jgi:hypothetical protein
MNKDVVFAGLLILGIAGCTTAQVATTNTIAMDATAVVADLTSAEQQIQDGGTVSAASLATINAAIAQVNTDIAALSSTGNGSTVLTDIETAIGDIEPFAPEIAALIGTFAAPAPGTVHVHLVKPTTLVSLKSHLTQFKSDVGAN